MCTEALNGATGWWLGCIMVFVYLISGDVWIDQNGVVGICIIRRSERQC